MLSADENPFRTSRLLALPAEWAEAPPDELLGRWQAAGRRGAWVGPHGTGKTTCMRACAERLREEGWRIVWVQWHGDGTSTPADWRAALATADGRTVACLDGSENLGVLAGWELRRRLRRAGGWLATLHRPRAGWPVLARHRADAEVFARHAESLAPGCEAEARRAFAAASGNAHEAFRRLYLERGGFAGDATGGVVIRA